MDELLEALAHAAWRARQYFRPWQREERAAARRELGLAIRRAFTECDDFDALVDALLELLPPPRRRD